MADQPLSPALVAAAKEYDDWWKSVREFLDESEKIKAPLYHYTSMAGLVGILEKKSIWFTSMFHLNDPTELRYGIEVACSVLEQEAQNGDDSIKFFCTRITETLRSQVSKRFGYYIACFSQDSDELGQWRAYADDGRGVAIGLNPRLFQGSRSSPASPKPNETFYSARVVYERNQLESELRDPIQKAISVIEATRSKKLISSEKEGFAFYGEIFVSLTAPLLMACATSKHRAYSAEREVRLIMMNDKERLAPYISTRIRRSELVPYITSPFLERASDVTEIVIGPAATADTEDAIQSLLLSLKIDVPVRRSEIPYRSHHP